MKINAKYGIVAALTMAAFVAPSVGALSTGSVTTDDTATPATKSTKLTFAATDSLVFNASGINYGQTWADILYSAKIKDASDKEYALSSYASSYENKATSTDTNALTWKTLTGTTDNESGATTVNSSSAKAVPTAGDYYIYVNDGTTTIKGTLKINPVSVTNQTLSITKADGTNLEYVSGGTTVDNTNFKFKLGDVDVTSKVSNIVVSGVASNKVTEVGTYTVTATVTEDNANLDIDGNVTTTAVSLPFTTTITVSKAAINDKNTVFSAIADQTYDGKEVTFNTITLSTNTLTLGTTVASNAAYDITYSNNDKIGTATITLTGKGNYTGSVSKTFKIVKKAVTAAKVSAKATYTGYEIVPVAVDSGHATWSADDLFGGFTISFANGVDHTNANTTPVKFTLMGDGTNVTTDQSGVEGALTIEKLDFSTFQATAITTTEYRNLSETNKTTQSYVIVESKGAAATPKVKAVYVKGQLVNPDVYTATVKTAASKAGETTTISINGTTAAINAGNVVNSAKDVSYTATVDSSISDATISGIAKAYTYNGNTKEPTPTVTLNGTKLVEGTDYVVSYKSNLKVGTASIVISGKGDYTGTKTINFYIDPAKSSIKKIAVAAKKMTVTVKKGTAASGVQIAYRVKGATKWSYVKTTGTSKTISSLKKGKKYQVVVRSYTTKSGKITNYSGWSATKTTAKIK